MSKAPAPEGRALATAGQRDRALEKFDEAIEVYRRVGAGQPWIDRAEADRARVAAASALSDLRLPEVFRREGDIWTITFEGQTLRLRDFKGLSYIARLLRNPGQELRGGPPEDAGEPRQRLRTGVSLNNFAKNSKRPKS